MKKLIFILTLSFFCILKLSSNETAFISTYNPQDSGDIFIKNARILTGNGDEILKGSILISSNKIKAIGKNLLRPKGRSIPAFANALLSAKPILRESRSSGDGDSSSILPSRGWFKAEFTTTSPKPSAYTTTGLRNRKAIVDKKRFIRTC